jgi:hypothetical protein
MTQEDRLRNCTRRIRNAMMTSMLMTSTQVREHRSSSKRAQLSKQRSLLQLCRNTFLSQSAKEKKNEIILCNTAL